MDKIKKFKALFSEVFDTNGDVTACGRVKCIEIIKLCSSIDNSKSYGDMDTGFMNIENIKSLYSKLN